MNRTTLLTLAVAALGGGAVWLLVSQRDARDPAAAPTPAARSEPPPADPKAAPVAVPSAIEKPQPPAKNLLLLPDGSTVPALNGVANPPKLLWQAPEWSPIVATERHGSLDWYKHKDGSYSTTMMTWRSDLGREDATSFSLHPLSPAPTTPLLDSADLPPVRRR